MKHDFVDQNKILIPIIVYNFNLEGEIEIFYFQDY